MVSPAFAQSTVTGASNRKQATATRVANGSIRVDGRLDDEVWQKATAITDFIQKEPTEGAAPTDPMEVRLAFDDDVLYVGARMLARDGRIQAPLGRRDNIDQAEHILVSFDTFLDRRTAAVFGVTAAGVRIDRYHSNDQEDAFDSGFDPVWRAETSVIAGGSTRNGERDRGNPFDDGTNLKGRIGADVKMGLGPNLTLETAINPDFGQVEADPRR